MPQPCPTPDTNGAYNRGLEAGRQAGQSEGAPRGRSSGQDDGQRQGYRDGYQACSSSGYDGSYSQGYANGFANGDAFGYSAGQGEGQSEGIRKGDYDGYINGIQQSNTDADNASAGPGREVGYADADAEEDVIANRGWTDGLAAGEAAAIEQAQRVDYPAGRQAVNDAHFAERIESTDSFSQLQRAIKPILATQFDAENESASTGFRAKDFFSMSSGFLSQLVRAPNDRCNADEVEQRAYQRGYEAGHDSAYKNAYAHAYRDSYQGAYRAAYRSGCRTASGNAREDYYNGYDAGRDAGYTAGYQRGYAEAFQVAYDNQYSQSSSSAYDSNYDSAYERYFDQHRRIAKAERSDETYQWNFNEAKGQRFEQLYPGLADEAVEKGRADEEQDFRDRPMRLLGAEIQDSNNDGIVEPNETLRVKLQLRNFGSQGIEGKDVRVVVAALQDKQANIKIAQQFLVKGLARKSVANVRDAMEVQLLDAALGKVTQLKVSVYNQGRLAGEVVISVTAKHLTDVRIVGNPVLKPGAVNVVQVAVKNQSTVALQSPLKVQFTGDRSKIRLRKDTLDVKALAPGEEQVVNFTVSVSRTIQPLQTAIAVVVTQKTDKKRVGLLSVNL